MSFSFPFSPIYNIYYICICLYFAFNQKVNGWIKFFYLIYDLCIWSEIRTILTNVYYAIVYPFLLYGITIWGSASKTLLNPLLVFQKNLYACHLLMIFSLRLLVLSPILHLYSINPSRVIFDYLWGSLAHHL